LKIEIREQPFEPWQELKSYEQAASGRRSSFGATAVFVGTMRDFNEGEAVQAMRLEHYAGMTERHLERITTQAIQRWALDDALVLHRIGHLEPGDPIVLVAVWSAHRAAAFDACRYIMEDLKSRAPFWKKEELPGGTRWVEANTPG
jgi:molybdopterin synthase catalytic subunit